MKIKIDKEKCIKCGACVATYPDHFRFADDGSIEIINEENISIEVMKEAVNLCPVQAIICEE